MEPLVAPTAARALLAWSAWRTSAGLRPCAASSSGLEPDAHGKHAAAEHVGLLHALDGGEARLHHAVQVVGDLVLIELVGVEAQIHRRELVVAGLDVDRRGLGLGRQLVADLVDLGADLRERGVGVVVEAQVNLDGAEARAAFGLDVIDAVGAGDDALELGGDVAADGVGAGAEVNVSRR
jgi:hypothetical protein